MNKKAQISVILVIDHYEAGVRNLNCHALLGAVPKLFPHDWVHESVKNAMACVWTRARVNACCWFCSSCSFLQVAAERRRVLMEAVCFLYQVYL